MSRVLILSKQQLKCNFCTNWFTTSSQFARMQKHSLNICQTCLKQFNFQIVNSQTFQIYHLFLINTGTKAITDLCYLQQKYQKAVQRFTRAFSNNQQKQAFDHLITNFHKYNNQLSNLCATISKDSGKLKDHMFEICKNHFEDVANRWEQFSKRIDIQHSKAIEHQKQIISILQTQSYKTAGLKMSAFQFQQVFTDIKQLSLNLKNKNRLYYQQLQDKIIWNSHKCNKCLENATFDKKKRKESFYTIDAQSKENFIPISAVSMKKQHANQRNNVKRQNISKQNNLKALRQRCIQNKASPQKKTEFKNNTKSIKYKKQRQYLKIANQSFTIYQKAEQAKSQAWDDDRQSIRSVRTRKNSQSSLLFGPTRFRPSHQIEQKRNQNPSQSSNQHRKQLKKNQSEKYFFTINGIDKQKKTNIQFDIERQKIYSLLKNKVKFSSYLPVDVEKQEKFSDKQWGDRSMVSSIIRMKQKTILNEDICELVSKNIGTVDFLTYLRCLPWKDSIKVIRMVKVEMKDSEFDVLLYWLSVKARSVHTLVVSNNELTQFCLQGLNNFLIRAKNELSPNKINLNSVYLGNNYIKPSEGFKYMKLLKQRGIQVHI